jgi:hypothetical protein
MDLGYLAEVPKIQMPKRAPNQRQMRGRPINREELERDFPETTSAPISHVHLT